MAKIVPLPPIERLKEFFTYNKSTGVLTWKKNKRLAKAGSAVGRRDKDGYLTCKFDGKYYRVHRLIWKYVTGTDPKNIVDHIDGDVSNNRFENFREASNKGSQQNRAAPKNNTTGYKGVYLHKPSGRFRVCVTSNYKFHDGGYFDSVEDAGIAAVALREKLHGEFVCHHERPST